MLRRRVAIEEADAGPAAGLQLHALSLVPMHLTKARDLARVSAVSRCWREVALDERLWQALCAQYPLIGVLKTQPGCARTWRALLVQHLVADSTLAQDPTTAVASDYQMGIELSINDGASDPDGGAWIPVFSALVPLAPAVETDSGSWPRRATAFWQPGVHDLVAVARVEQHGQPRYSGAQRLRLRLLLVRRSDGKMLTLTNGQPVTNWCYYSEADRYFMKFDSDRDTICRVECYPDVPLRSGLSNVHAVLKVEIWESFDKADGCDHDTGTDFVCQSLTQTETPDV